MNLHKISQYFFIIAAIITIFDGVFELSPEMTSVKFIVLILAGLSIGILRRRNDNQFFLSGLIFIVSAYIILNLLNAYTTLGGIGLMITDFVVFIASALFIMGLERLLVDIVNPDKTDLEEEKADFLKFKKVAEKDVEAYTFERIWGTIILFAVALTFVSLLTQLFFEAGPFLSVFTYVDAFITIVFIADLVVLYLQSKNFKDFAKRHVVDIIAAIPAVGVLRLLKLVRMIRIIKIMRGGAKLGQAVKMYKTMKFFSEHSYFNIVENKNSSSKKTARKKARKKASSSTRKRSSQTRAKQKK